MKIKEAKGMFSNKSINRRVRIRRSADITVYLSSAFTRSEQRLKRYGVRDLSNKGAFINMKPSNVHKDMQVYLIFALKLGSVVKLHRISAIVARVSQDGIGVRFLTAPAKFTNIN